MQNTVLPRMVWGESFGSGPCARSLQPWVQSPSLASVSIPATLIAAAPRSSLLQCPHSHIPSLPSLPHSAHCSPSSTFSHSLSLPALCRSRAHHWCRSGGSPPLLPLPNVPCLLPLFTAPSSSARPTSCSSPICPASCSAALLPRPSSTPMPSSTHYPLRPSLTGRLSRLGRVRRGRSGAVRCSAPLLAARACWIAP